MDPFTWQGENNNYLLLLCCFHSILFSNPQEKKMLSTHQMARGGGGKVKILYKELIVRPVFFALVFPFSFTKLMKKKKTIRSQVQVIWQMVITLLVEMIHFPTLIDGKNIVSFVGMLRTQLDSILSSCIKTK